MKRVRFHPEARLDARAAALWYRKRSPETARGFADAVAAAVESIRERPQTWPIWQRTEIRRRRVRGYPYSVCYVVEKDVVVILAIAHHKRRPGYWVARR
ncbi:MAG TPA: type II toxin-antitoxin system RelE/ParE family toxin [Kofleriaceae bacterium]|nr:type II toxin-antitoxin system RelE/ParE family toxin [Kofleriaceae bacterium]